MLVKAKGAAKKSPTRKKATASAGANGAAHEPEADKDLDHIHRSVTAPTEAEHLEDWVGVLCPYCG